MRRLPTIFLLLACLTSGAAAAQAKNEALPEQTSFCEGRWPASLKESPLPAAIITAVMSTQQGKEARALKDAKGKPLAPETLLLGTKVPLAESPDHFYVVMGLSPMSGGDHSWFWIVRDGPNKATVILFAGGTCLEIARTRTAGYRDLLSTWSSASETITNVYRYHSASYKLWRTRSKPRR